ncbi:MAG: hypothetical protein B7Z55_19580, partial [Planctomycetales bacterium 12-60-4]
SDLYSLGMICYELLTGERPYRGSLMQVLTAIATETPKRPSELRPGLSPELEQICLQLIAKEVTVRTSDASALVAQLNRCLKPSATGETQFNGTADSASQPTESVRPAWLPRNVPDPRTRGRIFWCVLALLSSGILFGIALNLATDRAPSTPQQLVASRSAQQADTETGSQSVLATPINGDSANGKARLPTQPLRVIRVICNRSTELTSSDWQRITRLPQLEYLETLCKTDLDDVRALRTLPHLSDIRLWNSELDVTALQELWAMPQLQSIALDGWRLDDGACQSLPLAPRLTHLTPPAGITDVGLRALAAAAPNVRFLNIYKARGVSEASIREFRSLGTLISDSTRLRTEVTTALAELPELRTVTIWGPLDRASFTPLSRLPNLTHVYWQGYFWSDQHVVTDLQIASIGDLQQATHVQLELLPIQDRHVHAFANSKQLKTLVLKGTRL